MPHPVEEHYTLHGVQAQTCWDSTALARAGADVLDYHGFAQVGAHSHPDWHLTVRTSGTPLKVPVEAQETARHASGLRILKAGNTLYLRRHDAIARIEPESGRLVAWMAQPRGTPQPVVLHLLLTFGLIILLQHRRCYAIHAAALAQESASGVLIVGRSESGKSTMAMNLLREGWHLLSDDSLVLHADSDGEIEALPLRSDVTLDVEAAEGFPESEGHRRPLYTNRRKWRVDAQALYPDQRLPRCIPRVLVFPELTGQPESIVTPIKASDALKRLMQESSFLVPDRTLATCHLRLLKQLASRASAFHLRAGRDLKENAERVSEMLGGMLDNA